MAWCPKRSRIQEKGSSCSHPCHPQLRLRPRTETPSGRLNCGRRRRHFRCEISSASDKLRRCVGRRRGCGDGFVQRRDGVVVENGGREEGREIEFPFCHIVMISKISVCYIIMLCLLLYFPLFFLNNT